MTSLVESYFGLKKPPFTTSESSGPVFMTEPLRAAAHFVRRGLAEGRGVQCISGPDGIGKSSFARALPRLCRGEHHLAALSGRSTCWEDMRRVLLRDFGIQQDRITRDGLEEARQTLGKLLIVVDDAEHLSPELLERVCILPQLLTPEKESVAQVVLLANLDRLGQERTRPLLLWLDDDAHHDMAALGVGEVHGYLDTRMRRVGWEGRPLIDESGASTLHHLSRGNPRRLSDLGMKLLELAASRGVTRIDSEFALACLGDLGGHEHGEEGALVSAPGTELCDEDALPLAEDWQEALASAPLTADNIKGAPSLELEWREAEPERDPAHSHIAGSPPLESICAVHRPPEPPEYISRYREPKGQSRRTLVFLICAALTAIAMATSNGDLAVFLADFSMPFSFATERIDAIDRVGGTNATSDDEFGVAPNDEPDLSSVLYDDLTAAAPGQGYPDVATTVALVSPVR